MKANRETIKRLFPELELVGDRELAEKAVDMWVYFWEKSNWDNIEEAAFSYEGLDLTLIQHTQSTVKGAIALADIIDKVQNIKVDRDLLIVACILHDVSKLVEYCGYDENHVAYKSEEGKAYQHAFLGAAKAVELGLPTKLVTIILCHTKQSNIDPHIIELMLLKCADKASAASAKF